MPYRLIAQDPNAEELTSSAMDTVEAAFDFGLAMRDVGVRPLRIQASDGTIVMTQEAIESRLKALAAAKRGAR